MSFSKLDSGIIHSSIWSEPEYVRVVWMTFLAMKDENGFVATSFGGMKRACNLINDADGKKFNEAIRCLEGPDEDSRTEDFDGRRIEKIEGGWIVLNHEKYRLHDDLQREKTRERVRRHREAKRPVTLRNVTDTLPSVSGSVSVSVSEEGDRGRFQSHHATFLAAGPAEWLAWDYQSGQAWARLHRDQPNLSAEIMTASAAAYREYCDKSDRFVKRPQNWLDDGDWRIDWKKQLLETCKPKAQHETKRPGVDYDEL